MRRLEIIALSAALAGCAMWTEPRGTTKLGEIHVEVNLPAGWMRCKAGDEIVFTRDGTPLEYIKLQRSEPNEAMRHTERKLVSGMFLNEVADLELDNIRLTEGVTNFELIENSPSRIDGRACYKLRYSHRIDSGLKVKTVELGCTTREGLYRIEYRGAAQHYFDQYLDVFESFQRDVRFVERDLPRRRGTADRPTAARWSCLR